MPVTIRFVLASIALFCLNIQGANITDFASICGKYEGIAKVPGGEEYPIFIKISVNKKEKRLLFSLYVEDGFKEKLEDVSGDFALEGVKDYFFGKTINAFQPQVGFQKLEGMYYAFDQIMDKNKKNIEAFQFIFSGNILSAYRYQLYNREYDSDHVIVVNTIQPYKKKDIKLTDWSFND